MAKIPKWKLEYMRKEINKLTIRCMFHRYLYYGLDDPMLHDEDYDKLEPALAALEKQAPQFRWRDSPTVTVGHGSLKRYPEIVHRLVAEHLRGRRNEQGRLWREEEEEAR